MNDAELIPYLAGYFDGEGNVCVARAVHHGPRGRHVCHTLRASVASTDPVVLHMLKARFGGHILVKARTNVRWSQQYYWCASTGPAADALATMLPYLHIKRHDAEIGIAFQAIVSRNHKGKPVTEAMSDERDAYRLQLIKGHGLAAKSPHILAARARAATEAS